MTIFPRLERADFVARAINPQYLTEEQSLVRMLADQARLSETSARNAGGRALALVQAVRAARGSGGALDAFLREYSLASREGVILMCLAEALLRIPDGETADRLIADKIPSGAWDEHLGDSDSMLVNASTWGLMLTGRVVALDRNEVGEARSWYARLVGKLGEPVARAALKQAMRILGHQFVMGRDIGGALSRAAGKEERDYRYSFDMLGEAALTRADAERYREKYAAAIATVGRAVETRDSITARHSISIKLSALHPRYEFAQAPKVLAELYPVIESLVRMGRDAGIGVTLDAEEAERLELSLLLIDKLLASDVTRGYAGFGLAVQAYQKRAYSTIEWLIKRLRETDRRIALRLVKGAYWDTEIKRAQERGLAGYPVFTRKPNTDVSYLACARLLESAGDRIYPQFATHNAHTIAHVAEVFAGDASRFEFQRLHGMGAELYDSVVRGPWGKFSCRVYAPVGAHEDLLPYLVRRLLENGANTSFVNRIVDASLPAEEVVADPVAEVDALERVAHPRIPLPANLFSPERSNSAGFNFADGQAVDALLRDCERASQQPWSAAPIVSGQTRAGKASALFNPADTSERIGSCILADAATVDSAIGAALRAQEDWDAAGGERRAAILERAAMLFEEQTAALVARCVREAGKTLPDAIGEVREAVDFLRYYATRARRDFSHETALPGPTGERNLMRLRGKGVFGCISPWNFPLAIYTGQVAAALAAGNTVVAKPAEQTPLTAAFATGLLLQAGVPAEALQFVPGDGAEVGGALTRDPRLAGVVFTGSTETARLIERSMAARPGAIGTLIAETGGLNVMLADSSALAEQLVLDVVQSGFNSAGQRCSALRVLLVQEEIAPRVRTLLAGCMDELVLGDPARLGTDVGPVIDDEAMAMLARHAAQLKSAPWSHRAPAAVNSRGRFFAPLAVEIESLGALQREVFGPVVHLVTYRARDLDAVVAAINALGYGLTLGIHTRIDGLAQRIARTLRVGNVYINRNMIGAVVGVQPFGGMGLSGTGPKAGGPHYLPRMATEQTITTNTAAIGGNAGLLSLAAL
ncbi:MAG TPA: bifunctional proline dehydrogenase/L-glutamate gamma-semialdehyde dehydrogenase PutA [Steroidobacteraceae bacterium]|jgi:RHH-type proline utilization regulon transcriptional repressor/proline dehydrogenase/delta 1-pyrroline-5-carboxylate dehydrogenase|nr:bifunctional proline dehydrogenase/L-glutamate gamma-semialdehyde dehydrogenase PutA [Steroidobacteraceae bacterium]